MKRPPYLTRQRAQSGFSLIELVVGLAIIAALAGLTVMAFDGSKSKGQMLTSLFSDYANSMDRLRTDTTCYSATLDSLFVQASAANSFCGIDLRTQWNGPYAKVAPVTAGGDIQLETITPSATLTIRRAAGGIGQQYFLRAANVANDVIQQALIACNGTATATGRCTGTPGTGATEVGTIDYLFAETR